MLLVHRDSKVKIYTANYNLTQDKLSQPQQERSERAGKVR